MLAKAALTAAIRRPATLSKVRPCLPACLPSDLWSHGSSEAQSEPFSWFG